MVQLSSKKLLRHFTERQKWNSKEYPCTTQTITNKLINKMVNRFWIDYFKDNQNINEQDNYLLLMFRVRLESDDIKTVTKLQKLRFSSKEFLKDFLCFKASVTKENYEDSPIKGVIFSWSIRNFKNLRTDFIDTILEQTKPIESKSFVHSFKSYKKLPIDTDLSLFGDILIDNKIFKNIAIDKRRLITVEIISDWLEECNFPAFPEIRKISLFKNNKVILTWVDKIISKETNSLIRQIGNTLIDFQNGAIIYRRIIIPLKDFTSTKPSKKINNKIIGADLETVLTKENKMHPFIASFINGKEEKSFLNINSNILFNNFFNALFCRGNKNFITYFHNLSGFDGIFLLKRLVDSGYKIEPLIHKGKLIQIKVSHNKLTFFIRDSLLLLLISLDKLGESFKISFEKGIFPFKLSEINYNGDFPPFEFFTNTSLESYEKAKKDFYAAAAQQLLSSPKWDFKQEYTKYCLNDSRLLRMILLEFNKLIFSNFKVDINRYPTLPSLAFGIFRTHYLLKNTIKIIPTFSKIFKNISQSYTGGSTDMFSPHLNILNKTAKRIYAYDVNSLYPFVMANYPYPIGDATYIEFSESRNNLEDNLDLFGFFYAEIVAPQDLYIPILQIHHPESRRTISPVGKFKG
jgi:DNA polymerase type B, organellar and viral